MSIKLINHRRRLLHKNMYTAPHKRHKNNKALLTKAEKIKLNKERKLAIKNKKSKKNIKKKPKAKGIKMPYRFKDYQFKDYSFSNDSVNLSKIKEE